MMQDFPAAHSMDTTWFAVDADGNIGIFDSGEGGAVPEATANLIIESRLNKNKHFKDSKNHYIWVDSIHDLFDRWSKETEDRVVRLEIPAAEVINKLEIDLTQFKLDNLIALEPNFKVLPAYNLRFKKEESYLEEESVYEFTHWLLSISEKQEAELLDILKQYCERQSSSAYIIRFTGKPALLFLIDFPEDTLGVLFQQDFVKSAVPLAANSNDAATLFGFFSYFQDSQIALPYECDGVPLYPLKPSAFPKSLQNWLTLNRFDRVKFPDSPKIQPIEHLRCVSYTYDEGWWVDCEGNERFGHPND